MKDNMKLNILGTEYSLSKSDKTKDVRLVEANAYCDDTSKVIVVEEKRFDTYNNNCDNILEVDKKILRHEIIHAFFSESGLRDYSEDEKLVDWIAAQLPKINVAVERAYKLCEYNGK